MARGVHNATSGYRRGLGKNGGGLPGQPSGRNSKRKSKTSKSSKKTATQLKYYGETRSSATPLQRKNRNKRAAGNAILAGGAVLAGGAIAYGRYLDKNPQKEWERDRAFDGFLADKTGRTFYAGKGGIPMAGIRVPKVSKLRVDPAGFIRKNRVGNVYRVTTAQKPRRGYR